MWYFTVKHLLQQGSFAKPTPIYGITELVTTGKKRLYLAAHKLCSTSSGKFMKAIVRMIAHLSSCTVGVSLPLL